MSQGLLDGGTAGARDVLQEEKGAGHEGEDQQDTRQCYFLDRRSKRKGHEVPLHSVT